MKSIFYFFITLVLILMLKINIQVSAQGKWVKLFDGKTFNGWRGYCKTDMPGAWTIEKGTIKIDSKATRQGDGGSIIYDQMFSNFELELKWKVAKGSNSGIFYLAKELEKYPIHYSSPEYQVLDNENHGDAKKGVDGNRKSASLYDMIPAYPQNSKLYGKWNKVKIKIFDGTVTHYQNGKAVVQYQLWVPEWAALLNQSKFAENRNTTAFKLLNNCGGDKREGYIGLQDHGDEVFFKNIRIRTF